MVRSQVCVALLVVAVCAAAQTPQKYSYSQDTNAGARTGKSTQQKTLKRPMYKQTYGNSPVNFNRYSAAGPSQNDNLPSLQPTQRIPINNLRYGQNGYYPRRQMYDGQDIPNPNYRRSYGYSSFGQYRGQPLSYGRYSVPDYDYYYPYNAGYRYPVQRGAPSYRQSRPAAYAPSHPYGQGAPYLRDTRYVSTNNYQTLPQYPQGSVMYGGSNNGENKGRTGQSGAGKSRSDGYGQMMNPGRGHEPNNSNGINVQRNGNYSFDNDRQPQSPQFGRHPDPKTKGNQRPSSNVDLAALFGNSDGRREPGAPRQPSVIDINALLKNFRNNNQFDGRPLVPTSMDLGSLYTSGGRIQGSNAGPSSSSDNKPQQNPGRVPNGQIVGAPVIYPNGGQQQTILPQRPNVQGSPERVQGRPVYYPPRQNAFPGRGNPREPTREGNNAVPQRYPQRNGQPANNEGILLTQEQLQQLFRQSENMKGSPEGSGHQNQVPYYGPSSGQPSAQPPSQGRPNVPGPDQPGNNVGNQRYPEGNNQPQDINGGVITLTPEQLQNIFGQSRNSQGSINSMQDTVPYYGPGSRQPPVQPPRRSSQPGPNNQQYPQGGGQRYPQGRDQRFPQGSDQRYPQGSDQRFPQGSDQRYPQGSNQRFPQGSDQRYAQESDQRYPQGSDQRYPQGSDQRYPQGSGQRFPQGGDQRDPQGSDQRFPQGSDQRYPQGSDQRFPQGGDQRYPQGSDQRYPQESDQRYPQGSDQGYEGIPLTAEQIEKLFGQSIGQNLPGNPSQGDSNSASQYENTPVTPSGQPTDNKPGPPTSSDRTVTQG